MLLPATLFDASGVFGFEFGLERKGVVVPVGNECNEKELPFDVRGTSFCNSDTVDCLFDSLVVDVGSTLSISALWFLGPCDESSLDFGTFSFVVEAFSAGLFDAPDFDGFRY